jgi:hypothetical protein
MKSETVSSWFDHVKNFWSDLVARFNTSSFDIVQILLYGGVAFIAGFLVNRYFRSLFLGILLSVAFIVFLHYSQIILIDMTKLKALLGITSDHSLEWYLSEALNWIKNNVILSLSAFFGFMIGYKSA